MHTYVHSGTVYNSKDLEPTQMPIDNRVDKENVAHIHHGILCSHTKQWVHVLCRDIDESGNHHFQQTDTRTENKTLHLLTHRQVLNNENTWTQGGEHHTLGSVGGCQGEGQCGEGSWGGITWGEMPDRVDGDGGIKSHCHVCTYATILHILHMYPRT